MREKGPREPEGTTDRSEVRFTAQEWRGSDASGLGGEQTALSSSSIICQLSVSIFAVGRPPTGPNYWEVWRLDPGWTACWASLTWRSGSLLGRPFAWLLFSSCYQCMTVVRRGGACSDDWPAPGPRGIPPPSCLGPETAVRGLLYVQCCATDGRWEAEGKLPL